MELSLEMTSHHQRGSEKGDDCQLQRTLTCSCGEKCTEKATVLAQIIAMQLV